MSSKSEAAKQAKTSCLVYCAAGLFAVATAGALSGYYGIEDPVTLSLIFLFAAIIGAPACLSLFALLLIGVAAIVSASAPFLDMLNGGVSG